MKKGGKVLLSLFIIALIGGGAYLLYTKIIDNVYKPVDADDTSTIVLNIPTGSSLGGVASILYDNNLIKNGTFFKSRVEKLGKEKEIKSGDFELSKSMSMDEIIDKITIKPEEKIEVGVKLVIPEGFERKLIAERLEEKGLGSAEAFMKATEHKEEYEDEFPWLTKLSEGESLEGFLFPATYDIAEGTSEVDIAKKMLRAFEYRMKDYLNQEDFNGLNFQEMITMASIIEREIKVDDERPIASSVFFNRIKSNMMLQSCATVQYILGERKPKLSNDDISVDSPYNTYINTGLPPAPIASPGMKSIEAAMNPAETNYLFFVLTGDDGSHTFSETYDEHLKAKENMK